MKVHVTGSVGLISPSAVGALDTTAMRWSASTLPGTGKTGCKTPAGSML